MRQNVSSAAGLLAGFAGASAVILGAFGAHALRGVLDQRGTELWHTAVNYHVWHALALCLALFFLEAPQRRRTVAAFAIGIVLFSGSLYALALGAPRWFGAITPLGGVAFIAGWMLLGWGASRRG
ncbi:DUF423 domain-containing protein [Dyella sp. 2RAB6]|uniref:DUF423 domain-containing protein n=1 Tax=Dyella sp. 2RAB6 TaxID=3232992 RepID=UPI003F8DA7C7